MEEGVGAAGVEATSGTGVGLARLRAPRPRDVARSTGVRLLQLGAAALTDGELLAVLLGGGRRGLLLPELAERLISTGGGLKALAQADPQDLCASHGLGPVSGPRLLAALELGRRAQRATERRPRLKTPRELFGYLGPLLCTLRREEFHVLCFNARNVLLVDAVIAHGSTSDCPVDPREVFAPALRERASAIVLAHNHPSGDVQPSHLDLELTHRLVQGAALLGVRVLDHLILGDGTYSSLLELGLLPRPLPSREGGGAWLARRLG